MESVYLTSVCPDREKFRIAASLLHDGAQNWSSRVVHALGTEVIETMTWVDFVTILKAVCVTTIEVNN